MVGEHPLVQDLIASVQKGPLLATLRDWRDEGTREERELLTELIDLIMSGEFDG